MAAGGSGVIDGQKKDDIGGYGEIFIFNRILWLESYGINLWKELAMMRKNHWMR